MLKNTFVPSNPKGSPEVKSILRKALGAIAPGASLTVEIPVYYLAARPAHMTEAAPHPFRARVDPLNLVRERNESNNLLARGHGSRMAEAVGRRFSTRGKGREAHYTQSINVADFFQNLSILSTLHIAGRTQPINGGRGYEAQGD